MWTTDKPTEAGWYWGRVWDETSVYPPVYAVLEWSNDAWVGDPEFSTSEHFTHYSVVLVVPR